LAFSLFALTLATLGLVLLLGVGSASAVVIRSQVEAFGSDGTASSSFGGNGPRDLAFSQNTRGLYTVDTGVPGIYGFDVSALPAHQPLAGFSPLATAATGDDPGIAVDNTALPSAGNVYFVSERTGLIYGFDKTGTPLGGNFPINPSIAPGAPFGSPKDICGAGVDSAGNLWVPNFSTQSILQYSSVGAYKGAVSTTAQGFRPCSVAFDSNDDMYLAEGNGPSGPTYKYTAASGYTEAILITSESGRGVAVDRSTHHVFTIDNANAIGEYDSAGNLISTTSEKDSTGDMIIPTSSGLANTSIRGVAVDSADDHVYVSDEPQAKIRVFGEALTYPDLTLGTASGVENTAATVAGTISAQGVALSDCHFEYVDTFNASGFGDLSSGGSASCNPGAGSIPTDSATHPVSATLSGLTANTPYHFRLVAVNANGAIATTEGNFETIGPPLVETTGSPMRTATTARLDSQVDPVGGAATYHFEYGDQGPCGSNPCTATEPHPAGSGEEFELVSQQLEGLEAGMTYHYRVVADNSNPDGPAFGEDMTLTTFADEAPLSHGHLPGPPGSDRAWEMVSEPDSGGNPAGSAVSTSDAGDRAVYGVNGGTPLSETGNLATELFAERTPSGWQTRNIYAHREEATGQRWNDPGGPSDLSTMVAENFPGEIGIPGEFSIWRMTPSGPATRLFSSPDNLIKPGYSFIAVSDDGSRVLTALDGTQDPEHPVGARVSELYDISSGPPRLVSLLPDGTAPSCGAFDSSFGSNRGPHWVSADGSLVFFPSKGNSCSGPERLYVRDLEAETTKLISTPALSGPECGGSYLIKSIPGAAFFYTQSRLVAKDSAADSCSSSGGDVYRYDLGDGTLKCVTCVIPGLDAGVTFSNNPSSIDSWIGVAEDGSRVYFVSARRLLPGIPKSGGTYRVDTASGDLAYVGPVGPIGSFGAATINPDGSVAVFQSKSPSLNALGGQQNGGTEQYYRYDDRDRSLVCVSCPADGSPPRGSVTGNTPVLLKVGPGANKGPLSANGEDFAFTTPTALVSADQNTAGAGQEPAAGTDVYEWREGRLLLVSDGLTNWPVAGGGGQIPEVSGIDPGGRNIFFTEAAQLTPDALDGYRRLYDARIGGGFEFPPPPKPCPLEVCQGTPKGAPEEASPGTSSFNGSGNVKAKAHKAKKHKSKHHKRAPHNRKAKNNRRAAR
jgi:hypothetical protein